MSRAAGPGQMRALPVLEPPDLGDSRAELWRAMEQGLPADGPSYVGLIGGLIAEHDRHPELMTHFATVWTPARGGAGLRLRPGGRSSEKGTLKHVLENAPLAP